MIHKLQQIQIIPVSIEDCWQFFSNPSNLARITPKSLDFQVIGDLPPEIYPGLMIEYRVRPLFGIRLTWLTEITHVSKPHFFVDEQRAGPYRIWHHEHHLRELEDGRVEMLDRVTYQLPLSPFSEIVHPFMVKPQLDKIFGHRVESVRRLFPEKTEAR